MELNGTFYPNVSRTINGSGNLVFSNDVILDCDTSVNPVNLTLAEIPSGSWSTQYKLYVKDKSGNASVNNITINAPVGFKINNQPSLVISTNGVAVVISIVSNTDYIGVSSGSYGGFISVVNEQNPFTPPATLTTALDTLKILGFQSVLTGAGDISLFNAFVLINTAELNLLIANKKLIPNQIYAVKGFLFGLSIDLYTTFIKATSNNTIDTYGTGEFYNADYRSVGNYSGVAGFNSQLGIWQSTLAVVVIGDVVIWDNYHYVNTSGVNTLNNPALDVANWKLLPYSVTNGYILEYNLVGIFDRGSGWEIGWRKDEFANYVEWYDDPVTNLNSLNRFQWGNIFCNQNVITGGSIFDCCNVIFKSRLSNNTIRNAQLYLTDLINPSIFNFFRDNEFVDNNRPMRIIGKSLSANFQNNCFIKPDGISLFTMLDNSIFEQNNFILASLSGSLNNAQIRQNNVNLGSLNIVKTGGIFDDNSIIDGTIIITSSTGIERSNTLIGGSTIQVNNINNGTIQGNIVENSSNIVIATNSLTGNIRSMKISNHSFLQISTINNGIIGDGGVKGLGVTLDNATNLIFDTFIAGSTIYSCKFSSCKIEIDLVDGSIANCLMDATLITLSAMNTRTLVNLTLKNAELGSVGFGLPETFENGEYIKGNGSIIATLDCSDPTIYDPATQTLAIPLNLNKFAGEFVLKNANGIVIDKLKNTNDLFASKFTNDNGSTQFNIQPVGVALINQIIGNASAPPVATIVNRINGQDSILTENLGTLRGVIELNIYV
jgi:hypothetical protein